MSDSPLKKRQSKIKRHTLAFLKFSFLCIPRVPKGKGFPVTVSTIKTSESRIMSFPVGKASATVVRKHSTWIFSNQPQRNSDHMNKELKKAHLMFRNWPQRSWKKGKIFAIFMQLHPFTVIFDLTIHVAGKPLHSLFHTPTRFGLHNQKHNIRRKTETKHNLLKLTLWNDNRPKQRGNLHIKKIQENACLMRQQVLAFLGSY